MDGSQKIYQRFTAILAIFMNSLLIHLIINKSPKGIGAYKFLMIHISVFEMAYKIEVVTKSTFWLAICNPENVIVPEWVICSGMLFWCFCFGLSLGNFAVHFIFRYHVIKGNRKLTNDCGIRILLWLGSALIFGFVWATIVHNFLHREPRKDGFIINELSGYHGISIERIGYFGFSLFLSTDKEASVGNLTGLLLMALFVAFSFTTMSIFGLKCHKALQILSSQASRSSQYKSLQNQLFLALVFQTLIPVVLMHIPCTIVLLVPLLNKNASNSNSEICGIIISFTISVFPVIDPLPSLIIIKLYRKALIVVIMPHTSKFTVLPAVITNSLLIHLIIHKSPKSLGSYKYLMIYISIFEIVYSIDDFLMKIEVITKGTYWLAICDPERSLLPEAMVTMGFAIWIFCFGLSLGNFTIHFIFRYFAIKGNQKWTSKCSYRIWIWLGSALAIGLVWASMMQGFEHSEPEKDAFIQQNLSNYHSIESLRYLGFSTSFKSDLCGLFLQTLFLLSTSSTTIIFAFKCHGALRTLTDQSSRSSQYKKLQNQLFLALVLQTLVPVVLMHIPCAIVLLIPLISGANWDIEICGVILTATISVFPMIDPLPSLFIITPYRRAIRGYLWCCGKKSSEARLNSNLAPIGASSTSHSGKM